MTFTWLQRLLSHSLEIMRFAEVEMHMPLRRLLLNRQLRTFSQSTFALLFGAVDRFQFEFDTTDLELGRWSGGYGVVEVPKRDTSLDLSLVVGYPWSRQNEARRGNSTTSNDDKDRHSKEADCPVASLLMSQLFNVLIVTHALQFYKPVLIAFVKVLCSIG